MAKQSKPSSPKAIAKPKATPVRVKWLDEPQHHDYPATASYLSLLAGPTPVVRAVKALQEAATVTFMAKDLLRAAGLPLLAADDAEVAKELDRVRPCAITPAAGRSECTAWAPSNCQRSPSPRCWGRSRR